MDRERLRCLRRFPRRAPFDAEEVPTISTSESSDRSVDSNLKKDEVTVNEYRRKGMCNMRAFVNISPNCIGRLPLGFIQLIGLLAAFPRRNFIVAVRVDNKFGLYSRI